MQGRERLRVEDEVPQIGSENVEKPHRRQNRAGERLLNFDVAIDDRGIIAQSDPNEAVDVTAVKIFIKTDAVESRQGVDHAELMQRRRRPGEERDREAEEKANREDEPKTR